MKQKDFPTIRPLLLLAAIAVMAIGARAQTFVAVYADPYSGGAVQVGTDMDLGIFSEGAAIAIVDAGETVYFGYEPYSGYRFKGIRYDDNLASSDVSEHPDGILSFVMPELPSGVQFLNIFIEFEQLPTEHTGVTIDESTFPDPSFRNWVLAQTYGNDGVITDEEMASVTKIVARGCSINDLTGIEHFAALTELAVGNFDDTPAEQWNHISSINLAGNPKLRTLYCNNNQIGELDLSHSPDLRHLDCSNNLLKELDVSANTELQTLKCANNQLTELNVADNTKLGILVCSANQLEQLDVSQNPLLEQLLCDNNLLTSIDLANQARLQILNCNDNQLTALSVANSPSLFQLYCYNNQIAGEAMDALIGSLNLFQYAYIVVLNQDSPTEQNSINSEQAALAKEKGWSVEVISNGEFTAYKTGDDRHDYVDMGLPSGTMWATCNVGADRPNEAGLFFAWGETMGHGADTSDGYLFNWDNYRWGARVGDEVFFTKYCSDGSRGLDGFTDGKCVLDPDDDAAYTNWGSQWHMPTKEQQDELKKQCVWTQTTVGDVNGYEVTGPNGNSIFLPETGWRIDDMMLEGGAFWSRSTDPASDGGAYYIGFDSWGEYTYGGRLDGQCVRPVLCNVRLKANSDGEGNYWATYYASADGYTADDNTTVYTAKLSADNQKVELAEVADKTIPRGNAVILRSTAQEITLEYNGTATGTLADNQLLGSASETETPPNTYMLVGGDSGVGFYHWTGEDIPAYRGYLVLDNASAAARAFIPVADSIGTTIGKPRTAPSNNDNALYDLAGRRVAGMPAKGIYVKQGKKIIWK